MKAKFTADSRPPHGRYANVFEEMGLLTEPGAGAVEVPTKNPAAAKRLCKTLRLAALYHHVTPPPGTSFGFRTRGNRLEVYLKPYKPAAEREIPEPVSVYASDPLTLPPLPAM